MSLLVTFNIYGFKKAQGNVPAAGFMSGALMKRKLKCSRGILPLGQSLGLWGCSGCQECQGSAKFRVWLAWESAERSFLLFCRVSPSPQLCRHMYWAVFSDESLGPWDGMGVYCRYR